MIKTLESDPNIKYCPKAVFYYLKSLPKGCSKLVRAKGNSKYLICECGQEICSMCGNPYHKGISCEDALDGKFKQAMKEYQIHKCPKCQSPI